MLSNTRNLFPLLLVSLILNTGCNSEKIHSQWPTQSIQIDGSADDWNGLPKYYFEDAGVSLGVSNDADNAYLIFRFTNPKWLMSIAKRGITVWLDGTGKKKKNFSITYSGKIPFDSFTAETSTFRTNLAQEQQQRLMMLQAQTTNDILVFDATEGVEKSIPPDGMHGLSASLGSADGVFTYEFAIPLHKNDTTPFAISAEPGKKIYIGLEFGQMDEDEIQQMRAHMKNGRGHGGGRSPGGMGQPGSSGPPEGMGRGGGKGPPGGMGRGGGGRGGADPEEMMKKMKEGEKIWVKTYLALPPPVEDKKK